eukprot:scaffold91713_cov19-Tisochrysis_lutea.AAC.1
MHVEPFIMGTVLGEVDVIVGMDALSQYKANLSCEEGKVKVVTAGERHWLKPHRKREKKEEKEVKYPYISVCSTEALKEAQVECLSAKQAAKQLKKGAASWLLLVKPEDEQALADHACASCANVCSKTVEGLMKPEVLSKVIEDYKD